MHLQSCVVIVGSGYLGLVKTEIALGPEFGVFFWQYLHIMSSTVFDI